MLSSRYIEAVMGCEVIILDKRACSASKIAGRYESRRVRRAVIGSVSNRENQWADTHHIATCDSRTCGARTSVPNWKVQ
jgi:hypothetical protein